MRVSFFLSLFAVACMASDTRPMLTTESPKYHGRKMSNGNRYDKHGSDVAVNRKGFANDTAWLFKGYMGVRVIVADRFNKSKTSLPYFKIDAPAWILESLGMCGKGRIDSIVISHNGWRVHFP